LPSGELAGVHLRCDAQGLRLVSDDGELELPAGALRAVMLRYGAPFDAHAMSQSQAVLALGAGASLRHVRHLAGYDVIARDYLVYAERGLEEVGALPSNVEGEERRGWVGVAPASGDWESLHGSE